MKDIRLLVYGMTSCATFLYKEHNIILNPTYYYNNGNIKINFDAVLVFDHKIPDDIKLICDAYEIPVIGTRRYTKFEQHIMLSQLNIMCPDTFDCNMEKTIETVDTLLSNNITPKTEIILKPYLGAKGIGQVRMKRGEIYDKLYDLWDKGSPVIEEAKRENDNNKQNPDYMSKEIRNGTYCIQVMDKISEEYRIIFFYENDPIILRRNRGFITWQVNNGAKPDNDSEYIGNNKGGMINLFGAKFVQSIGKLFDKLNVPFLSLDVYKNKDGFGIMEFQMEFGYKNCPTDLLCNSINSSVKKMLNKSEEND